MLPSLYVSHGSPALMIMNNETTKFLESLSSMFEKPKYILVISAHWVSSNLKILYENNPSLIYDFYNFPSELYQLEYKAKSDRRKADEIVHLLEQNDIQVERDILRGGFDHGVWSPLKFMYPDANIPVIQLSLPINFNESALINLGEILSTLREDTLILASGAMTHNLRGMNYDESSKFVEPYAKIFRDWIVEKLEQGEISPILEFRKEAPYLAKNHPSLEHFLPLLVSLGASKNRVGKSLHDVYMYGNQSMDTIIFEN